jgi:hypothetical protein
MSFHTMISIPSKNFVGESWFISEELKFCGFAVPSRHTRADIRNT